MNLVLAHGLFGFRRLLGIENFNRLAADLEAAFAAWPIRILVPEVPPIGRIAARGEALARSIAAALGDGTLDPARPVHIVAHSMGGLDARYCIAAGCEPQLAGKIASLTTLGTPHRGSPVADLLTAQGQFDPVAWVNRVVPRPLREALDTLDLLAGGILELTSSATDQFNRQYPNAPGVAYFSYAARGRGPLNVTAAPLLPLYYFIRQRTGHDNDGLVTIESAKWGTFVDVWPGDHADMLNHDLNQGPLAESTALDVRQKYREIVTRLAALA